MPFSGKSPDPNPRMSFIVNFYFLICALEIPVLYNLRSGIKIYNAQACTIITGTSLKNKNDFLITPRRRAGSSKKYIIERHLENKMLKYRCD